MPAFTDRFVEEAGQRCNDRRAEEEDLAREFLKETQPGGGQTELAFRADACISERGFIGRHQDGLTRHLIAEAEEDLGQVGLADLSQRAGPKSICHLARRSRVAFFDKRAFPQIAAMLIGECHGREVVQNRCLEDKAYRRVAATV